MGDRTGTRSFGLRMRFGALLLAVAAWSPAAEVTNLLDSDPGSLRSACAAKHVVFSSALAQQTIVLQSRIDLPGASSSMPWKLVEDVTLLRLAQSRLAAASAQARTAWITLACHLALPRSEILDELAPLKAASPRAYERLAKILMTDSAEDHARP